MQNFSHAGTPPDIDMLTNRFYITKQKQPPQAGPRSVKIAAGLMPAMLRVNVIASESNAAWPVKRQAKSDNFIRPLHRLSFDSRWRDKKALYSIIY